MKNFGTCEIDEELKQAMDEMIELYKRGKYAEIAEIRDDKDETDIRRLAASEIAQWNRDPRRIMCEILDKEPKITIEVDNLEEGIERMFKVFEYEDNLRKINARNRFPRSKRSKK